MKKFPSLTATSCPCAVSKSGGNDSGSMQFQFPGKAGMQSPDGSASVAQGKEFCLNWFGSLNTVSSGKSFVS